MPKVNHNRMKPKYNATPTAREKAFHQWAMATYQCACGCGRPSTVVHHPLVRHTNQRWRRDHEFVAPMFWDCHVDLHMHGSETGRFEGMHHVAFDVREQSYSEGIL